MFWPTTIFRPVNGSATAEMSGVSRCLVSGWNVIRPCHCGLANSAETPPAVPCDSGASNQACSASQPPFGSVDNVVPPTLVISGIEATASRPTLSACGGEDHSEPPLHSSPARSPLASNAVVPFACALASAARTGTRSAAVISLSQPHPIEKLHTAPG